MDSILPPSAPRFEFHISRSARERCGFDEALFHTSGRVVLARPAAAHRLAERLRLARGGNPPVSAADLFALGLLDEIAHLAMERYRRDLDASAFSGALPWLSARLGMLELDRVLLTFVEQFPPMAVYRGGLDPMVWLAGESAGVPHRAVALEEMLALWLTHANDAAMPYGDLFQSPALTSGTAWPRLTLLLRAWFETRPRFGPQHLNLVDFLRAPALAAPHSLTAQLEWVSTHWNWLLGDLVHRLMLAADLRGEEDRWLWAQSRRESHSTDDSARGASGPGAIPNYSKGDVEFERFSADADWMPRTVLMAKSTYVWLDQLSRRHQRAITRLDEIPDEELDALARFGIDGLWLIGLWERSQASQRIKQLSGNPDAAASAYSLADYRIASDLGGEEAWRRLRDRAAARGIRLASDMVPNHMGLDSPWLIEHPEWFVHLDHAPYPSYTFHGPDLSSDGRVTIQLEDHYYDRSDAAVVFRVVDHRDGRHRFVYHGNDGTSFPWNDTAQLDYTRADVREQVIRTILDVARRFPIIRFDAAMTLARRHIRRLWFPEPGAAGAIPSRSGYGMSQDAFDAAVPREFWREVVDRVAAEAPGTLLLAEAFWLMEGYFVRTLGMHRVYNSAFMHMLRDEQNANYRSVIKNTLEFDPEVLQRYVNFMNNPDEKTAVEQFGRGEKYFGVCTLLATLPGLPMFGHGQLEGFEEKYGMEFRRASRDENRDEGLWAEHWRRISPLLHRRWVFAGASEFLLYDAFSDGGTVNEDVYAYSNRAGGDVALVLFNNRHADMQGWIRTSAAYAEKRPDGSRPLRQRTLAEGLALPEGDVLMRCRDIVSGLEHLFRGSMLRERGLRVELGPYGSRVLVDWRVVSEDGRPWRELEQALAGAGCRDLEGALWQRALAPVHARLPQLVAAGAADDATLDAVVRALADDAARLLSRPAPDAVRLRAALADARAADRALARRLSRARRTAAHAQLPGSGAEADLACALRSVLLTIAGSLGLRPQSVFDDLRLRQPLGEALAAHVADPEDAWRIVARLRLACLHADAASAAGDGLLDDADARWLVESDGEHFADAPMAALLGWLDLPPLLAAPPRAPRGVPTVAARLTAWNRRVAAAKGDRTRLHDACVALSAG